jgi:SAM-dependent methyltransferase
VTVRASHLIDWRQAWAEHNQRRPGPGNAEFWDGRAKDFEKRHDVSEYAALFLELLAPAPNDRIMDVGCGTGALALPLARAGHEVFAVDFSASMLASLEARRDVEGLENLSTHLLDWNEDWDAAGIEPGSADIVIASRSTMVADLHEAFSKLSAAARKRVAVTMATEFGPKAHLPRDPLDRREPDEPADYIFGVNLLIQMGLYPRLAYIDTRREGRLVRWAYLSWNV